MKVITPSIEVFFHMPENGDTPEQAIEKAGRTCYKSENKISEDSASDFVKMIKKRGHHAMLEFGYATAKIIGDRGLTHELVRHRLCSFAQESTRYCNYSKGKFENEITVIEQPGLEKGEGHSINFSENREVWIEAMLQAEKFYLRLIKLGVPAQIARSVLPIGLKAEIYIGANLREWRHIFKMRCDKAAHPIIRGVMLEALKKFNEKMPSLYEDQADQFLKDV